MAVLAMTASAPVHRIEARAVPRGPPCVVCRCAHLRESGDHLYQTARPGHHSFARPRLSPMPDDPREDEPDESDEAAPPVRPERRAAKRPGEAAPSVRPERRAAKRPEVEGRRALPARGDDRGAAGGGGLVRYDTLRAYMAEGACQPVLSREEEHALAVRYTETGDVDAAYKLVASNLRLVVKIAHEYRRTAFQLLDLVQEGNLGLMRAVKKYDPWKGVKLSSYAAWWIRAYIIRFVMENWRMVKLGTTQAQRKLFFNLSREREKLLARGIDPTPRLLAKNLEVEEKEVEEMTARMSGDDVSLDAPVSAGDDDSRQTHLDRLPAAETASTDDRLGDEQLRRIFREKLDTFARTITDEKERFIFEKRLLPADGEAPLTLQEVGDRFRLTRERARQIEAKLTARLRDWLRAEIPDFELLGPPEN